MNIEDLINDYYEDLNGRIYLIESNNDTLIYFECDDWIKENKTRKFKITCLSVKEISIAESIIGNIDFTTSDPILWNHNEEHGYLYYSSEAANSYELLGRVWEAHERIFNGLRPLAQGINAFNYKNEIGFGKGTYGELARGPKLLMDAYVQAISGKIKTNYVSSYIPEGGYSALFFDLHFVICKSIIVEELNS